MRATLAISLADSIFQTAWIARSVSVGVEVVTPATTACCTLSASAELPRLFGRYFRGVEDLQHLGLAVASDRHEALPVLDRLRHRVCPDQREAVDQFLGLRIRPVSDGELASRQRKARAAARTDQAAGHQQHAGLAHLFAEFADGGHLLGG